MSPNIRTLANGDYALTPGDFLSNRDELFVYVGHLERNRKSVLVAPVEEAGVAYDRLRFLRGGDLRKYSWADVCRDCCEHLGV